MTNLGLKKWIAEAWGSRVAGLGRAFGSWEQYVHRQDREDQNMTTLPLSDCLSTPAEINLISRDELRSKLQYMKTVERIWEIKELVARGIDTNEFGLLESLTNILKQSIDTITDFHSSTEQVEPGEQLKHPLAVLLAVQDLYPGKIKALGDFISEYTTPNKISTLLTSEELCEAREHPDYISMRSTLREIDRMNYQERDKKMGEILFEELKSLQNEVKIIPQRCKLFAYLAAMYDHGVLYAQRELQDAAYITAKNIVQLP